MNWKTACKIVAPAAACAGAFAFLVAPGRATRAQKAPFLYRNYAHRGLHTEDADSDLLLEADCAPMTEADSARPQKAAPRPSAPRPRRATPARWTCT